MLWLIETDKKMLFCVFLEEGVMGVQLTPFSNLYELETEQYNVLTFSGRS